MAGDFFETRGRKSKGRKIPAERPMIDEHRSLPFVEWAPKFLKIRNIEGTLVPFKLQPIQLRINALMDKLIEETGHCHMVILKPRRVQASSIVQARMMRAIMENPGWNAGVLAHEEQSLQLIFSRARTFHESLPEGMQHELARINRKEMSYREPHASAFKVNVSKGKGGFGRGGDFALLHFSEAAHYQQKKGQSKAEGQMLGIINSMPRIKGAICVIESTAAGVGSEFHQYWLKAKAGVNGFEPVFFPWYDFPEYRIEGKSLDSFYTDPEWEQDEPRLRQLGCDDAQLCWRRWTIANKCGADIDTYRQEYPSSPDEAFLASGSPVFRTHILADRRADLQSRDERHPTPRYSLDSNGMLREDKHGDLRFWRTIGNDPDRSDGERYVITADPAGSGASAVTTADRFKGDPYCAHVWDRRYNEQVAELHGYFMPEEFAEQLDHLHRFYGRCLTIVEGGPWGGHVISCLQKLGTRLYFREAIGENEQVLRTDWTRYGWATTAKTKPQMIDALRDLLNDKAIIINSLETIGEMLTFVKKGASREAAQGCHDDRVVCCAIFALWSFQHAWVEVTKTKYEPPKPKALGEMLAEWIKEAEADKSRRRAVLWQL